MNNINVNQKRPNRQGANNPMFGRHHTEITKKKQSEAAKQRAAEYKRIKDSQHHVSMEEFLANNPSVKEYIKVLANSIIKEEINKTVCKKQQNIPL